MSMIVGWILRLYPKPWRERYEEELRYLASSEPVSPRIVFNLLAGAFDAHLHPNLVPSQGNKLARLAHRDAGTLLASPHFYQQQSKRTGATDRAQYAVLSWFGWAVLGVWFMGFLIGSLWTLGWIAGLTSPPDRDSTAVPPLHWFQILSGPVAGNLVVRRFVHAGLPWKRDSQSLFLRTIWVVLGVFVMASLYNMLWVLVLRDAS